MSLSLPNWLRRTEAGRTVARQLMPGLMASYARGDQEGTKTLLNEIRLCCARNCALGPFWLMFAFNEALKTAVTLAREVAVQRGVEVEELFSRLAADALAQA